MTLWGGGDPWPPPTLGIGDRSGVGVGGGLVKPGSWLEVHLLPYPLFLIDRHDMPSTFSTAQDPQQEGRGAPRRFKAGGS